MFNKIISKFSKNTPTPLSPAEMRAKALSLRTEAEALATSADNIEPPTADTRTAKEIATAANEPWVNVMQTRVDHDNPKNGFFELDWNDNFILMLRGAGFLGHTEEEVIDGWFKELCKSVAEEESVSMDGRATGYIKVTKTADGKVEVS